MDGHQGHLVLPRLLVVGVGEEHGVLEVAGERRLLLLLRRQVAVPGLAVLLVGAYGVHELPEVVRPFLRLLVGVALVGLVEARGVADPRCGLVGGDAGGEVHALGDVLDEVHQSRERPLREPAELDLGAGGGLPQGHAPGGGHLEEAAHRGVAETPRRLVGHTGERLVVVGVHGELEVGHEVLHLQAAEEGRPGVDCVGDARLYQGVLDGAGLRVGPVEDGEVPVLASAFAHLRLDGVSHEAGFVLLRVCGLQDDAASLFRTAEALFLEPVRVVRDEVVRRRDDVLRRAVVLLQFHHAAAGIVFLEADDVLDPCAPEGVDGLGVIAHHADVLVQPGEPLQDGVLGDVRVLVLVHEDVVEAAGDYPEHVGVVRQEHVGVQEDVVEVHHGHAVAGVAVGDEDAARQGPSGPGVAALLLGVGRVGVGRHEVVLAAGDDGLDRLGLVSGILFLVAEHVLLGPLLLRGTAVRHDLADAALQRGQRVVLVQDGEVRRVVDPLGERAEETDEHRVERAHADPPGGVALEGDDARAHLVGRLLREGEREDPLGRDALRQQVGDPDREDAGLAASGARVDEHRAERRGCRLPLCRVEPFEHGSDGMGRVGHIANIVLFC